MLKFRVSVIVLVLGLATATARSELFLTAEVVPTTGLTGFDTYRITATSNLGKVVTADLTDESGYGVFGPLGQVNPYGQPTIFANHGLESGSDMSSQDTHFLVEDDKVFSMFARESESAFHGLFTFVGEHQLSADQSLPFLQISTSNASEVSLKGDIVLRRENNEYVRMEFDTKLSDILIGAAPQVELLPIPVPVVEPPPLPQTDPVTSPTPPTSDPTVVDPDTIVEVPTTDWEAILEREREWLAKYRGQTDIEPPDGDAEIQTGWHAEQIARVIQVWPESEWIVGDPSDVFQMPEGDFQIINVGVIDSGIVVPYLAEDGPIGAVVTAWDGDEPVFGSSATAGNLSVWHGRSLQSGLRTFLSGDAFIDAFKFMAQASDSHLDTLSNVAPAPEPSSFVLLLIAGAAAMTRVLRRRS